MDVLRMHFRFTCLILVVFIGCMKGTECGEMYQERTIIHRLLHRSRYFLGYELEIEVDYNGLGGEDEGGGVFVSRELQRLLQVPFVSELLVASTQGMWRTGSWGEPPARVYTSGSILDVGVPDMGLVSEGVWSSLLSRVSSIMCNSLTVFEDGLSREKRCTPVQDGSSLARLVCNNYDDTLCTDNLFCWRRILPCLTLDGRGMAGCHGILGMISVDSFVKASYKSIGLELRRRADKTHLRIFLNIVVKGRSLSLDKRELGDTLWSLVGLEEPKHQELLCPLVESSKIIYFLYGRLVAGVRPSRRTACRIVPFNHPVHTGLHSLEVDVLRLNDSTSRLDLEFLRQECGMTWMEHISDLHDQEELEDKSKLSFLNIARSYVRSVKGGEIKKERTQGSLVIAMDNLLPNKSIRVCHWEQFPRYISPWFHKTRVLSARSKVIRDIDNLESNDGEVEVLDSHMALKFLNLGISRSQSILASFCLELAPRTNVIVIFKFQKPFLPLGYLGGKAKRGQISPPSVSYWRIQQESADRSNSYRTVYHNISIVPTIYLDHTMTFNVLAITCAFIVFGMIITTKPTQLSPKNVYAA
ncbi:hypothetical protein OJ253_402 [Cryptosporidium canis]|uniref:Uncharacterized protein n=1 Tax=Cryptosporidium canis TaxID=195482 RepID=A0A9D5HVY5_9CRYT|nr:hypothetical protein OJ253_402 [Cryptosporidium canis]